MDKFKPPALESEDLKVTDWLFLLVKKLNDPQILHK